MPLSWLLGCSEARHRNFLWPGPSDGGNLVKAIGKSKSQWMKQAPMVLERANGYSKRSWMNHELMIVARANGQSKGQWIQQELMITASCNTSFTIFDTATLKVKP